MVVVRRLAARDGAHHIKRRTTNTVRGAPRSERCPEPALSGYNLRLHMAIDLYWGSSSACCWRVLLALEHKGLEYRSHLLQFDRQEHKSPQMLAMNSAASCRCCAMATTWCSSRSAILYYLDRKYPDPPIFGRSPEEAGVIMRVICEYQAYAEPPLKQIVSSRCSPRAGQNVAWPRRCRRRCTAWPSEARTIELRLARSRLGGGRELLGRRHDHLPGHPAAAAGAAAARRA